MSIKIIENCISKNNFQNIRDMFYSDSFAWFLQSGVNTMGDGYTQFCHTFYISTLYCYISHTKGSRTKV